MKEFITPSNIMFSIGIIGLLFTIWEKVKTPQINSEKVDALMQQRIQWTSEATEKKFCDMNTNIKEAMTLAQNHIHTVDTKVENLIKTVGVMSNEITKLSTIIEERMPRK